MNPSHPLLLLLNRGQNHPQLPLILNGLNPWSPLITFEPCAQENADQLTEADGLRERLGHQQLLLFGFAEGSLLALAYAIRYPTRVFGLMLCSLPPDLELPLSQYHFLTTPTLILAGRQDPLYPALQTAELCHAILPNSQLVVFDKSGHYPFVDEEEQFTAVLLAWLAQL